MIISLIITMIATLVSAVVKSAPPAPPPSLTAESSMMTDFGLDTPKENDLFRRDPGYNDVPHYFVEFDSAKVNKNAPLNLTTTWSYEGAVVPTLTSTCEITELEQYEGKFGAWVSPDEANWMPEAWDGELYHWSVKADWSNKQVTTWNNLLPQWGDFGMLISRTITGNQIATLGGSGSQVLNFTVNPEPISSSLFLAGGALLACRLRRKRK